MQAQDHILAWIESSRPHYDRLLEIENFRKSAAQHPYTSSVIIERAGRLVADAYRGMVRGGDASRSDLYSPADMALAVALVVIWELEQ